MGRRMVAAVVANLGLSVGLPVAGAISPTAFGILVFTYAYWFLASTIILAVNAAQVRGRGSTTARRDYLLLAASSLALLAVGIAVCLSSTRILYSIP